MFQSNTSIFMGNSSKPKPANLMLLMKQKFYMNFGKILYEPKLEETQKRNAAIKKERTRLEDILDAIQNLVAYSDKTQGYYRSNF